MEPRSITDVEEAAGREHVAPTPPSTVEAFLTVASSIRSPNGPIERTSQVDRTATKRAEILTHSHESNGGTMVGYTHYPDGTVSLTIGRGDQVLAGVYIRPDADSDVVSGVRSPVEVDLPTGAVVRWAK